MLQNQRLPWEQRTPEATETHPSIPSATCYHMEPIRASGTWSFTFQLSTAFQALLLHLPSFLVFSITCLLLICLIMVLFPSVCCSLRLKTVEDRWNPPSLSEGILYCSLWAHLTRSPASPRHLSLLLLSSLPPLVIITFHSLTISKVCGASRVSHFWLHSSLPSKPITASSLSPPPSYQLRSISTLWDPWSLLLTLQSLWSLRSCCCWLANMKMAWW